MLKKSDQSFLGFRFSNKSFFLSNSKQIIVLRKCKLSAVTTFRFYDERSLILCCNYLKKIGITSGIPVITGNI